MLQLPVQLTSVNDRADRSGTLKFVTRELDNEEFVELREYRGLEGWLMFGLDKEEVESADVPSERPEIIGKTPSQRLRSILFVHWKQGARKMSFEEYYRASMEKLINKLKEGLQDA